MGLCSVLSFKSKDLKTEDPKSIANLVSKYSVEYGLDPEIFASLIYQESRGNVWAQRYEVGFYKRYIEGKGRDELSGFVPPRFPTLLTEQMSRAYSWGLCQIMGETIRWMGFDGVYLAQACDPSVNIRFGAKYLRRCLDKKAYLGAGLSQYKGALALYNGKRDHNNSDYDERVLEHVENGNYNKILNP